MTRPDNDRGSILLLVAFSMVALIGIAGLAVDASLSYDTRNKLGAVADHAAKSGAFEIWRGNDANYAVFAQKAIDDSKASGEIPANTAATIRLCSDAGATCLPAYQTNKFVEVLLSSQQVQGFTATFGLTFNPGNRAVAGTSSGPNCIVTLGPPSNTPESLSIGASSTINLPTCAIADGGDLIVDSSAYINASSTGVVGVCSGTGPGCTHVTNMGTIPPPSDPLASVPEPIDPGSCQSPPALPGGGTPSSLSPGCYNFVDATATGVNLTLSAGTYYFKGPFAIGNNASITGAGVLLFFSGTAPVGTCPAPPGTGFGCISVLNNAAMNLSAPTSGPYTGILMFSARTNQTTISFTGNNPTYNFSGALYFASAHLDFDNGLSGSNDCTLIVARSLEIDHGTGTFDNRCAAYSGSPLTSIALAE